MSKCINNLCKLGKGGQSRVLDEKCPTCRAKKIYT